MTGAVLVLCDGRSPRTSETAEALALRLAAEAGLQADVAFSGAESWTDRGWTSAWRIEAEDGRGAAAALAGLIENNEFAAVLGGDSSWCREVLGRLAGRLALPIAGRVLSATLSGNELEVVRTGDGGRRSASYRLQALPALVLVDPDASVTALPAVQRRVEGRAISAAVPESPRIVSERALAPLEIAPHEAETVVAGGRGLGQGGFALVEELAGVLRGAVGASRVAVDLGWAPRSCQVGMTGQVVQARLYIAAGISGAIHHTFGMKDSGFIVAINTDPGAPIFKFADAAIVGDASEILAALIEEMKRRQPGDPASPRVPVGSVA